MGHRLRLDPADAIDAMRGWSISADTGRGYSLCSPTPASHVATAGVDIVDVSPGLDLRQILRHNGDIENVAYTITDESTGCLEDGLADLIDPARPGLMVLRGFEAAPGWEGTGMDLAVAALALHQLSAGCNLTVAYADRYLSPLDDVDEAIAAAGRFLKRLGFTPYSESCAWRSYPAPGAGPGHQGQPGRSA
jgi:hypothetical protein